MNMFDLIAEMDIAQLKRVMIDSGYDIEADRVLKIITSYWNAATCVFVVDVSFMPKPNVTKTIRGKVIVKHQNADPSADLTAEIE